MRAGSGNSADAPLINKSDQEANNKEIGEGINRGDEEDGAPRGKKHQ